jgi:alpha-N-arabinofuranosidase
LSASASKDRDGKISVTITNLDPNRKADVTLEIAGAGISTVSGHVLTARKMNAMNTVEKPAAVKPAEFRDFKKKKDVIALQLPAKSVTVLRIC